MTDTYDHAELLVAKLTTVRAATSDACLALAHEAHRLDDQTLRERTYDLARTADIPGLLKAVCAVWDVTPAKFTGNRRHRPPTWAPGTHLDGTFPVTSLTQLPPIGTPCVYTLSDPNGVIYVGLTTRPRRRLKAHQADPTKPGLTTWHLTVCPDEDAMADLEAILIAQHQPRLNHRAEARNGSAC